MLNPEAQIVNMVSINYDLWHNRFAHPGNEILKHAPANVKGLPKVPIPTEKHICKGCVIGKEPQESYPSLSKRAKHPLELVHFDLTELPIQSNHKYKYIVTFLDDCSSYTYSVKLRLKSEAFLAFNQFKAWAEKQTGCKIKKIRIDQGGEFLSDQFTNYLKTEGIKISKSEPHIHQQNRCAERIHHTNR